MFKCEIKINWPIHNFALKVDRPHFFDQSNKEPASVLKMRRNSHAKQKVDLTILNKYRKYRHMNIYPIYISTSFVYERMYETWLLDSDS